MTDSVTDTATDSADDPKGPLNLPHLARLARLSLPEDEARLATEDLANIIQMIDQMQSVNTDGVVPMAHPLDAVQRLRADTVTETDRRAALLANAPDEAEGYFLVPRVVE